MIITIRISGCDVSADTHMYPRIVVGGTLNRLICVCKRDSNGENPKLIYSFRQQRYNDGKNRCKSFEAVDTSQKSSSFYFQAEDTNFIGSWFEFVVEMF